MFAPMFGMAMAMAMAMTAADPTWQNAVSRDGWVEVRTTDEVVLLLKRSGAPSAFWLRSEMRSESATAHIRYDCGAWTLQITQTYKYTRPNMDGDMTATSTASTADVPPPGSLLDGLLEVICEP